MKFKLPPINPADEEFNIAPMIDIVFQLLLFFMVASHLNQMEKVQIGVPVAAHAVVPREFQDRRIITIRADGQIYLGSYPHSLAEVEPLVEKERARIPDLKIYLRADKNVPHKFVREVMEACAAAGAAEIIFATYEKEYE